VIAPAGSNAPFGSLDTPQPGVTGTVHMDYQATDGMDPSNTAKITITIEPNPSF